MKLLYNISIYITPFVLRVLSFFNKKISLFVNGRKNVFNQLEELDQHKKTIWFHCASLGEFEQGRPIIEEIKRSYPDYQILLTFFSPSGFEIRKDYDQADVITYLPLDTITNANKFIKKVKPFIAIFVKYEFWPNYLKALNKYNVKTVLISGIFRKNQLFFKGYGKWMQQSLKSFHYFFLQDKNSQDLLSDIGFHNSVISGDTRFDRVQQITKQAIHIEGLDDFSRDGTVLVAGSTWPKDEEFLINYINEKRDQNRKFIIVPHHIEEKEIVKLKQSIHVETALYSAKSTNLSRSQVLIVDTIGLLSKVYKYGDIAYVGGGFGSGIHNILEPATFGLPILIGPNYEKFNEAKALIALGACEAISHLNQLTTSLDVLFKESQVRDSRSKIAMDYIDRNTGATSLIMNYLKKELIN